MDELGCAFYLGDNRCGKPVARFININKRWLDMQRLKNHMLMSHTAGVCRGHLDLLTSGRIVEELIGCHFCDLTIIVDAEIDRQDRDGVR